jgi:prepilin-type N-terminal cleavage/methylation domain-containing protein
MMIRVRRQKGFTLIELLVVVSIIALLISILLPSLARARAVARLVTCQTNVRQIATAFVTYSVENDGELPGNRGDNNADWLGGWNGSPKIYGVSHNRGKQPEWGTIYKKHLGGQKYAYTCPDDNDPRPGLPKGTWYYSYTGNLLLSGAKTEAIAGAHYPTRNYNTTDHRGSTTPMKPFDGVPVIIEEHPLYYLTNPGTDDSGWCNDDSISFRHLVDPRGWGRGTLGFTDGHVGWIKFLRRTSTTEGANYFCANDMCIRTKGKWFSGRAWAERAAMYGWLNTTRQDAVACGVRH